MEKIFNTVYTTERHRKWGTCEPSDFGTIELIRLSPSEKELAVSFKDHTVDTKNPQGNMVLKETEYIVYGKDIYVKVDYHHFALHGSREEQYEWLNKKQGKLSDKTAKKAMLDLRESCERSYSTASDYKFIIIGNTLYQ